jgi:hypothetical protein
MGAGAMKIRLSRIGVLVFGAAFCLAASLLAQERPRTPIISAYSHSGEGPGQMKLLPGYVAGLPQGENCVDTECGSIWNPQGLTIHYDIGGLAGQGLESHPPQDKEYLWFGEAHINDQPVRYAVFIFGGKGSLVVCYPLAYANFDVEVRNEGEIRTALKMLLTYRGGSVKPRSFGTLDGRLTKRDGTAISKADIRFEGMGVSLTFRSDDEGHFVFKNIMPGHYTVTAKSADVTQCGFAPKTWKVTMDAAQLMLKTFEVRCR